MSKVPHEGTPQYLEPSQRAGPPTCTGRNGAHGASITTLRGYMLKVEGYDDLAFQVVEALTGRHCLNALRPPIPPGERPFHVAQVACYAADVPEARIINAPDSFPRLIVAYDARRGRQCDFMRGCDGQESRGVGRMRSGLHELFRCFGRRPGKNPDPDPTFPGRYWRALDDWHDGNDALAVRPHDVRPLIEEMARLTGTSPSGFRRRCVDYGLPLPVPWPPPRRTVACPKCRRALRCDACGD